MAEQQSNTEFSAADGEEILAEREEGWERFRQFAIWAIVLTVVVLVLLAFFVA